MPAKSGKQYRLAQGILHSSIVGKSMSKDVASEMINKTPSNKRKQFSKNLRKEK